MKNYACVKIDDRQQWLSFWSTNYDWQIVTSETQQLSADIKQTDNPSEQDPSDNTVVIQTVTTQTLTETPQVQAPSLDNIMDGSVPESEDVGHQNGVSI